MPSHLQIGILVGLASTSVQSVGLTLQRKSHILEDEKDPLDVRRPPYRRRRWQLGMLMFMVANLLGSSIQITTLPLPVLSTLQASGLVFNSICATLILGEPFTRWSLGGTLLVSGGAALIALFGALPDKDHTLEELLELLGREPFVLWMIGQAVLVAIVVSIASFLGRLHAIASNNRIRLLRGLAYGCISGILSGHSLLVAKTAVGLLVRSISDRQNQFNHWQSWMNLLALVTLALTQLYYLHRGLKLVSTSVLYPLVFCIYNITSILDGLIYFDQANRLTLLHSLLIALGTVILLAGVLALSWRLNDEQAPPPVAHNALAPGLGLVDESDNDEYDELCTPDEEAAIGSENRALLNGEPMTPTTKLDTVLGATRPVRKVVRLSEADEIWGELDDDAKASPPRLARRSQTTYEGVWRPPPLEEDDSDTEAHAHAPDESTSLLRSRTLRRKRRRSTGFPGFMARPQPPRRTLSIAAPQGAMGGFWRMRWLRGQSVDLRPPPPPPEGSELAPSGGDGVGEAGPSSPRSA
jgi:drug/metabolite transporter (DMT)-like permease